LQEECTKEKIFDSFFFQKKNTIIKSSKKKFDK